MSEYMVKHFEFANKANADRFISAFNWMGLNKAKAEPGCGPCNRENNTARVIHAEQSNAAQRMLLKAFE